MKKFEEKHIKDVLNGLLGSSKNRLSDKFLSSKIEGLLKEEFGEVLFPYVKEVRFFKNTLYLKIESASFKQELSNGRDALKRNLNLKLDSQIVQQIRIS